MWGKSPDEAFAALLVTQRWATAEQLDLMMMRWSRPLRVRKNGVTLKFYGIELQYRNDELWLNHFGEDVYVRYDPEDLNSVRIYDLEERFMCGAQLLTPLSYFASKEEISARQSENRAAVRKVRDYLSERDLRSRDALETLLERAAENMGADEGISPKLIIPLFNTDKAASSAGFALETPADKAASSGAGNGGEAGPDYNDWARALKELKQRRLG